ncbi:hypothetical protein H5410_014222 [Solanum commersonii]|uniref:ARID domain-containing protein n=1 Tax=Solanum commersonii TaxID=4109 RepID=A0A9J5ZQD3_SOLCO|nr:hypothetical protein H5410_014222 [Solanum commersonii]
MLQAETNVPAIDVLVSNESPVMYKNGVKTGKSNDEDKTHDQSDSKGEDSKNARSETEDQLNSKSQLKENLNMVLENKKPTIDAGTDDMVNGYVKVTDDKVQNIDEGEVNDIHQNRSVDPQIKTNATTITTDGDARSDEFPKVTIETDDGEDNEGSPEDQAAFIGKLGTFYREKVMEFKLPKFYGHLLNCLKLWRSVIRLGRYDWVTGFKLWRQLFLPYERHRTQNGELQFPIAPPHVSWGIDNEGSGYQISASGKAVRDSAVCCRLGWQEQHFLGYGEVAEPIVKDRSANNTPKRAKSLKISGSIKHQGQNEVEHPMKAAEIETSKSLDVQVVNVGPPTDWVKINVRVQSDPAGRLVITCQPNQLDNLWGVTAFKKVVTLPARIDQLRTNVVVTLHGCLHVHVPFVQQNL